MRTIPAEKITASIRDMAIEACRILPPDVLDALRASRQREESELARSVIEEILENAEIARAEQLPLCQDTGLAVVFLEIGQDVHVDGDLMAAVQEGVRRGYADGYLRKSVCDCLSRKNTGDNTPAIVHIEIVPGDVFRVTIAAKGGGSENMSRVTVLKPSEGVDGIKKFVRDRIIESGGNPCPPLIVGIGIGGTIERCAYLAKKALLRKIGEPNPDPEIAKLEKELLTVINETGVGPMGYGGRVTALAVHALAQPCHIASIPLAVNINCHSHRHKEAVL